MKLLMMIVCSPLGRSQFPSSSVGLVSPPPAPGEEHSDSGEKHGDVGDEHGDGDKKPDVGVDEPGDFNDEHGDDDDDDEHGDVK